MSGLASALLLAAAFDGEAALRHASALAALGPHPWGSPRSAFAAEYVAAEFRSAGLEEVRLQEFEAHGLRGANVIGVLRAPGSEFVVVGAHHDSVAAAPGAYDDGGGVGVLIETARLLARERRPRTIVFASFDAEESALGSTTPGSRAYVQSLGSEKRNLVAALVVEMCGWKSGTPVLHPIPYPDPMRPGKAVMAPAWLVRTAISGARSGGGRLPVGDRWLSWVYQPAVRSLRVPLYGDDISFLQDGLPAVFLSDSSFSAFYPWYHQAGDTADKIDAASLARMGGIVVDVVRSLERAPRAPAREETWFAAFGYVGRDVVLLSVAAIGVMLGLIQALAWGGLPFSVRLFQSVLFAILMWRHPVPALWALLPPILMFGLVRGRWLRALSFLPLLALVGLGVAAWRRGMVLGFWLAPWELGVALLVIAFVFIGPLPKAPKRKPSRRR
jgi:hypothetical protein